MPPDLQSVPGMVFVEGAGTPSSREQERSWCNSKYCGDEKDAGTPA
ncbi:MAG: hypothetical protein Q7T80_16940 [Methanoregula sp.]|nr:hypothetical protein [Methanoregula sp.]